ETAGAELGGAETEGEGSGGAAPGGAVTRGASSGGAVTRGVDSGGAASPSGGGAAVLVVEGTVLVVLELLILEVDAGGAAGAGGAGGATGAAGAGGAGAAGAGGAGVAGTALRRLFFYLQPQSTLPPLHSVLRQVLSLPSSTGLTPPLLCSPTDQSQPQLLPGSPLPAPALHTEESESLTECHEPEAHASTPVCSPRVTRPRPLAIPGTHGMAVRPSSVPQCVVLPEPLASSLPHVPDPESLLAHDASPSVTRFLATIVTDSAFESATAFALVTELVDIAARSRLDYVANLVAESESVCPPSVGGELALSSDVLKDMQFELECLAAVIV
ncbi:unnamed protein product, partial [Closterium sp. NIES-54]